MSNEPLPPDKISQELIDAIKGHSKTTDIKLQNYGASRIMEATFDGDKNITNFVRVYVHENKDGHNLLKSFKNTEDHNFINSLSKSVLFNPLNYCFDEIREKRLYHIPFSRDLEIKTQT
ncbi:MAG: hypothetical protein LE168_02810 [Endomicrobium sp.]|nr:hypothetical protein [Endomicrobium sp.]